MPCYSTVTKTTMTELERLEEALRSLKYTLTQGLNTRGEVTSVFAFRDGLQTEFFRRYKADGFSTESGDLEAIKAVQRKYTELGVRAFAKKRGFTVSVDGLNKGKLILTNRRDG
jgi:hypothetical protein